jgi:hypothetical protein
MGVASDLKGLFEGAIEWFLKVRRIAPASHSRRRRAPGVRPTLCFVVGCAPRWCACVGLWGSRPSKRTRRARSSSASSTAPAKARCWPPHAQSHMRASAYARMHPADLSTALQRASVCAELQPSRPPSPSLPTNDAPQCHGRCVYRQAAGVVEAALCRGAQVAAGCGRRRAHRGVLPTCTMGRRK